MAKMRPIDETRRVTRRDAPESAVNWLYVRRPPRPVPTRKRGKPKGR